jgi:hypothetical protein
MSDSDRVDFTDGIDTYSYDGIIDSMDERLQKEVKQAIIKATGPSKDKSIKDLLDKVIEDCK